MLWEEQQSSIRARVVQSRKGQGKVVPKDMPLKTYPCHQAQTAMVSASYNSFFFLKNFEWERCRTHDISTVRPPK